MLWVAAAGPASNLIMAIFWAILLNMVNEPMATNGIFNANHFFTEMSWAGISINLVLMVLNLIPLPPLDGGRIAVSLLPNPLASQLSSVEKYGFFILIALMFTGILGKIISPFIQFFTALILRIFT